MSYSEKELHDLRLKAATLRGNLIPIDYVDGLTTATVTDLLIAGRDAETKDELYARYLNSFGSESFGGNIADYREKVMSFDGIGGCKVYPVWDGPGTVKCVVVDSDGLEVSDYLVEQIQEAAQPTGQASGYGFAPIDHTVTVESAEAVTLNVTATITYASGVTWNDLKDLIRAAVDDYIAQARGEWPDDEYTDSLKVYVSRVEAAILSVNGVEDVSATKINNSTANKVLAWNQIPVLGTVNGYGG